MGSNGSFFQNGLPLTYTENGLGNVNPGPPAPNKASSSFYLSGSVYQTLANQDALLALITADTATTIADLVAANVAAASAAASAAAAIVTLSTSLKIASNLSDLASVPTALINLGLNNVTNTSDVNKPVSTAQATADALVASNAAAATALKANTASPTLTGVPAAPTAAALNNSTQLATTAYADAATATLSGTVATALGLKAPLASPSLTGVPVAPTAAALNNSTQLSTTAYADAAVAVEAAAARNATNLTSGTVPTARLPLPSGTTLGGVQSLAVVASKWINTISTSGVPAATQPAFTDISGSVSAAQMPALTGDVTTTAGTVATTIAANAVTNAKMATMATLTVKTNITGGAAVPTDSTVSAILDAALGSTRGQILARGASLWGALGVGTNTQVLTSNGVDPGWAAATGGGGGTEVFALHAGIGGL